ncbi:MAG: lipopolysaccharide heptosyltransferase II [Chloroflexi bacterium]|nr:lipopolysaccharide heptosyltransferase II [Chloroflexota bacterium]
MAILYVFFATVGLIGWLFTEKGKDFSLCQIRKILLIRLDLMGDAVFTMPAVQAIRYRYPQAHIAMLVLPYTAPLVAHFPYVDEVIAYDINKLRPSGDMLNMAHYRQLWRLVRRLRREHYDLCISFFGLYASLFSYLSGAHFRIGYRGESYPFMHNIPVTGRRYKEKKHEIEYNLVLAEAAGATRVKEPLAVRIDPQAKEKMDLFWANHGIKEGDCLIAIHPGSINGSAKRWTTQGWAELSDILADKIGANVVFVGVQKEVSIIDEIVAQTRGKPMVLAGQTTLPDLLALLRRCQMVLGGDSAPVHIAEVLGTPTVVLHGPTDPALSGPYHPRTAVVQKDLECSPCYDLYDIAECPRDDPQCMRSITATEVYAAVESVLRG